MDDYSMNHTSQSLTSRTDTNSSEESGWTLYFEDFLNNNCDDIKIGDDEHHACSFSCSRYQDSSIISGADFRKVVRNSSKLVSKNRMVTAKTVIDEELEDTASSPCNSPKVNDLNQLYMKSNESLCCTQDVNQVNYYNSLQIEHINKYFMDFSQEKLGQTPEQAGEGIKMGYLETQLRRKGLCLVPMSMLINNLT